MFAISFIFSLLASFLRLAITEVKTTRRPVDEEVLGGMPSQSNIVNLINNLKANAAPAFGNFTLTEVASSLAAHTYTAAEMAGGFIRRHSTASLTDSVATGTNLVAAIPGAVVGQTFPVLIHNAGSGTLTVATNTGVTLVGTATITRFSTRVYLGEVTGSAAVTLRQCFQFSNAAAVG